MGRACPSARILLVALTSNFSPIRNMAVQIEFWRTSQNEIVRFALNNRWLEEQGASDLRAMWIVLHFGPKARV